MTGPMAQVGWASACSGVTPASSACVRPRNGPPEAVTTSLRTSARLAAGQRLEERGVLGVDGDDLAGRGEGLDQRAADDQRLLVGQGQHPARLQRGQGRGEADGAGDAVEHGVAGGGGQLGGRVGPGQDLGQRLARAVAAASAVAQGGHRVLARDGDGGHPQPVRLLGEQLDPAAGRGERGHPEAVGVAQHDVDGLGADRSGRAEDHDVTRAARAVGVAGGRLEAQDAGRRGSPSWGPLWPVAQGPWTPRACLTDHRAPPVVHGTPRGRSDVPDRPRGVRRGPLSGWAGGRCPSGSGPGWRRRSRGRRRWGR